MARLKTRTGVYSIVNRVNGKKYVGSAVDIDHRWSTHRGALRRGTHHCPHLQKAFNAYGEEVFNYEVLELCVKESLIEREQAWIDAVEPYLLYNTHHNALHWLGRKHTPETKAKIAKAKTGKPGIKGVATFKGRKHSPETIEKMRNAAKARPPCTEETRRKRSENAKRQGPITVSAEGRKRQKEKLTGRIFSPEHKQKLAEAARRRCEANPERMKEQAKLARAYANELKNQ